MAQFTHRGAAEIAAIEKLAGQLLAVFAAEGFTRTEPAIIQPIARVLDREGEEMRGRTFIVNDPAGNEFCLRTDLTIPACAEYLEVGGSFPARLCYHGPVFRHQPHEPARPVQFWQAGIEILGLEDRRAGEIEAMRLTVAALRAAGLPDFEMKIGDLGLFSALVDGLDIPEQWRGRLKRHFWRSGYFEALLARMTRGAATDSQRLLAHLGTLAPAEAGQAVEGLLDLVGHAPLGGRTREEIVERLIEQAADAAALRLDPALAALLSRFLQVSGPAAQALADIRALTTAAGAALDSALDAMTARLDALSQLGIDAGKVRFAARFGRNMEYYTGFVFELWSRDAEGAVQVAGGGRYDGLLEALGSPRPVTAVGSAIRTERVLAALRFAGRRA
ncbi:MAG: ATP phosphoribosyltransferase regulatory subunit [Alphaproteobacteria bacterium]|nr:ATP phosphoribosyltransferase regulatory subunit [Alphaproteobacteria bacterium]MBV9693064.1 ATP phosphoribosyltransferase regulatory subunit [Alphaproteobacteria bacterium]